MTTENRKLEIENRKLVPSLPASDGRVKGSQSAEVHPPEADSSRPGYGETLRQDERSAEPQPDRLMARFQGRLDADAFEQIFSSYMSHALAVARQILSDHALAEDAVQESFLKVIRKRQQYIPGSPFSCWFYAIVRNVCVDMLRKQARHKNAVEEISARNITHHSWHGLPARETRPRWPCHTTDDGGWAKDDGWTDLLGVLTSRERDVLMLRIVHGLGFRDIAAALGISEEAAKKRAQRALRRLHLSKILISKF